MRSRRLALISFFVLAGAGGACGGSSGTDIGNTGSTGGAGATTGHGGSSATSGGTSGSAVGAGSATTGGHGGTASDAGETGGAPGADVVVGDGPGGGGASLADAGNTDSSEGSADGSSGTAGGAAGFGGAGGASGAGTSGSAGGTSGGAAGNNAGGTAGTGGQPGVDGSAGSSGVEAGSGVDAASEGSTLTYQLMATISGGTGKIVLSPPGTSCGANCTTYAAGASVLLVVTPSDGYLFIGWGGDCSGSNAATGVTMSADRSCVANVVPILDVSIGGKGGGTVSDSLGGITDCQQQCIEPVSPGTTVGLTAKAAQGYTFAGWSGDCSGTSLDTMVTMDTPKSCTATFNPIQGADAGAGDGGGSNDGGQCNSLPNLAPLIKVVRVATDPPVYKGGDLVPGTYVMQSAIVYTGPGGATGPDGTTIRETLAYNGTPVSGPITAVISTDGAADVHVNGSFSTSIPSTLAIDYSCGPFSAAQDSYTVIGTQLKVYDPVLHAEWSLMRIGAPP